MKTIEELELEKKETLTSDPKLEYKLSAGKMLYPNLQYLLIKNNHTTQYISDFLNISRGYFTQMVNAHSNKKTFLPFYVEALAKLYDVPVEWLLKTY